MLLCSFVLAQHRTEVILSGMDKDPLLKKSIQDRLSDLLSGFNSAYKGKRNLPPMPSAISIEARQRLEEMWAVKSFYCPETELILNVLNRTDGNMEVRNVPIQYDIKSENVMDDELVIIFNRHAQIQGVLIALDREKYTKLFSDAYTMQDQKIREILLNFLENFRTAYNRKDINYIEQVFSDDALIIVGKVLSQNQKLPDNIKTPEMADQQKIEYVKLKKGEYVNNLKRLFKRNAFVKVEFTDFKFQRHHEKRDFYGIQLLQKWRSSNYSDDGYLFLLIDLRDEDKPIIWVRTGFALGNLALTSNPEKLSIWLILSSIEYAVS